MKKQQQHLSPFMENIAFLLLLFVTLLAWTNSASANAFAPSSSVVTSVPRSASVSVALNNVQTPILALDQGLTGFTVGVTIYHYFIQSPTLMKFLGKEKFTPLMMALTRLWAKVMFISSTANLLTSLYLSSHGTIMNLYLVVIGWMAMTLNRFVVVPAALKAGARSTRERKGDNSKDLQEFAVSGGGKTQTKALHQTVVVFVLIMVGGFIGHLVDLTSYA